MLLAIRTIRMLTGLVMAIALSVAALPTLTAWAEGLSARPGLSRPSISRAPASPPVVARPSITNHAQNMRNYRNAMSAADGSPEKQSAIQRHYRRARANGTLNGGVNNEAGRQRLKRNMEAIAAEK